MTDLVPCPLCGGSEGYWIETANTGLLWNLHCNQCNFRIARLEAPEQVMWPPKSHYAADEAWNAAGGYADKLRRERDEARAEVERIKEEAKMWEWLYYETWDVLMHEQARDSQGPTETNADTARRLIRERNVAAAEVERLRVDLAEARQLAAQTPHGIA